MVNSKSSKYFESISFDCKTINILLQYIYMTKGLKFSLWLSIELIEGWNIKSCKILQFFIRSCSQKTHLCGLYKRFWPPPPPPPRRLYMLYPKFHFTKFQWIYEVYSRGYSPFFIANFKRTQGKCITTPVFSEFCRMKKSESGI